MAKYQICELDVMQELNNNINQITILIRTNEYPVGLCQSVFSWKIIYELWFCCGIKIGIKNSGRLIYWSMYGIF